MTIRTLFSIILKILGIFLIKDILITVPQLFPAISFLANEGDIEGAIWTLVSAILILLVYVLICWLLIFRSELIINKLKLDKGFEQEKIATNIHRSTILSISIIVIGGLILTDEMPNLCRNLYDYFNTKKLTHGQVSPDISYSVLIASKIIIGLLLIGSQRHIVNYIESRRKQ